MQSPKVAPANNGNIIDDITALKQLVKKLGVAQVKQLADLFD